MEPIDTNRPKRWLVPTAQRWGLRKASLASKDSKIHNEKMPQQTSSWTKIATSKKQKKQKLNNALCFHILGVELAPHFCPPFPPYFQLIFFFGPPNSIHCRQSRTAHSRTTPGPGYQNACGCRGVSAGCWAKNGTHRTHVSRTPKIPWVSNGLIATYRKGSVGIRSHQKFLMDNWNILELGTLPRGYHENYILPSPAQFLSRLSECN